MGRCKQADHCTNPAWCKTASKCLKQETGRGSCEQTQKIKSEFMEWFVAQHKRRTDSGMPNHTDQQLRDMVHAGKVAERVLACRELWDEKQTSALYAWQAREAGPNVRIQPRR